MPSTLDSKIDWDSLKDRSVIITGGASGLGEATATKFVEHGAFVTIADVSKQAGERLAKKLGSHATFVYCDTTDWESCAAAFRHSVAFAPSKTLDLAVLFAGIAGNHKNMIDSALEEPQPTVDGVSTPARPYLKTVDVNLTGVYQCAYLALYYFRLPSQPTQTFKKSLVLVSSIFGYMDVPNNTGYNVSKFGIRGLFRSLRGHGYKVNSRVNNLAPSYICSPMTAEILKERKVPWSSIESLVEGVGKCAVDEGTDGKCTSSRLLRCPC